jgi:hypothetical protein
VLWTKRGELDRRFGTFSRADNHLLTGMIERRRIRGSNAMRFIRASIAGLMGAVLIAALGLAALRSASDTWAGTTLLATCGVLGLALVGMICRGAAERAWWLGFALFGWGYLAMAFWSPVDATRLPTFTLLELVCKMAGIAVPTIPARFGANGGIDPSFLGIAHCLWALLAASLGGILGSGLFAVSALVASRAAGEPHDPVQSPPMWWRRPLAIGLSGLALAGSVAVAGMRWEQGRWSGTTFLLTCGLLVLAATGAVLGRGRTRAVWLGAALFGWGYLILAFGWHPYLWVCPNVVTNEILKTIRPWLPSSVSGIPAFDDLTDPANARILKLLEETVPIHFREPTTFEQLLKHIKIAASRVDGKDFPIFVDPIGLHEAEKSLTSTVRLYRDDLPLKTSLHYCLRQLGLTYRIAEGFVMITSADQLPIAEDPFMIVGHCLLALVAAALGGAAGPLVVGGKGSL